MFINFYLYYNLWVLISYYLSHRSFKNDSLSLRSLFHSYLQCKFSTISSHFKLTSFNFFTIINIVKIILNSSLVKILLFRFGPPTPGIGVRYHWESMLDGIDKFWGLILDLYFQYIAYLLYFIIITISLLFIVLSCWFDKKFFKHFVQSANSYYFL